MKLLFPSPRPAARTSESRNSLLSVGHRVLTGTDVFKPMTRTEELKSFPGCTCLVA